VLQLLGLSVAALKARIAGLDTFGLLCSDVATLQVAEAAAKKAEEERRAAERAAMMTHLIKSAHKKLKWDSSLIVPSATTLEDGALCCIHLTFPHLVVVPRMHEW
jgi:hypothetical protein